MEAVNGVMVTPHMQAITVTEAFSHLWSTGTQNSMKYGIKIIRWLQLIGTTFWD